MRFLVDNPLSPVLATLLTRAGHDALHVRTIELQRAEDVVIFDRAAAEERIVVSADTDFGTLLAARTVQKPSVIQFRGPGSRRPDALARAILRISRNLPMHWNAAASSRSSRRAYACAHCRSTPSRSTTNSL
jgi:predicted nuclease of predicted toxin-antitoxin system